MTTAPKNQARDLEADLAICEAATSGPWENEANIRFAAEAREGWPYAIRRALAAEEEIDRLRNEISMLYEALNQRGCGL